MNFIAEILSNNAIIASIMGWFVAQTIKVVILTFREKKFSFSWYLIPGGFPSSHSAATLALCTVLGIEYGFSSGIFAVALGLTAFVLYDASVLRRAAQRQAKSLNKLIEAIKLSKELEPLREVLGHNWFEIMTGSLLGILVGLFFGL